MKSRDDVIVLQVDGREIPVTRPHLKVWITSEGIRQKLVDAIRSHNRAEIAHHLSTYLTCLTGQEGWEQSPWETVVTAYVQIAEFCAPRVEVPIFMRSLSSKEEQIPWEYEGRGWYFWAHLLSQAYGWTLNEIAELEIEDGLALFQEIMVADQLEKEWQWSLSEVTHGYDTKTKKSTFKPLPRPTWMLPSATPPKRIKINPLMIPVGNVIDLSGLVNHGNAKP